MVTSKRKIVREEDKARYYEEVPVSKSKEESEVRFNDDLMMMRSYVETPSIAVPPAEPAYRPAPAEAAADVVELPARKPLRVGEVMPVVTKRLPETVAEKETTTISKSKTLSPSMKKALVLYLSIVILLTIAVITTGVLINSVTTDVNGYEDRLTSLSSTAALQQSQLGLLSDPQEIAKRAEELGMVEANSGITTPQVSIVEPEEEVFGNPFDDFLDWIGGIFGG